MDGQDLENQILVALGLCVYKATELRPKANPSLHLPSLSASLFRLWFDDVSWRETSL